MARINGNEIKPGFVLEHDGGLWAAVKVNHVKPGKGGAFANVIDRARDGVVTDYLHTDWWPTFNLADAFISVGAGHLAGADSVQAMLAKRGVTVEEVRD